MFVLNKINKSLATFTIKKRDRTQIIKKRNERGKKTTNTTEKQTKITLCCEQLYANKLDKLEEMNEFLETCSSPKLNPGEIDNLKKPITRSEIESVSENLSINKTEKALRDMYHS